MWEVAMIRYVHTNLITEDWRKLASFYERTFGCIPMPPHRDLSGKWLDKATGIDDAHIRGIHLRLPGYPNNGPTLEIFEYGDMPERPQIDANTPGFAHIAFAVDDVERMAAKVIENGGSTIGDLTHKDVDGVGRLTFQYARDPEGSIIELQSWSTEGF